MAVQKNPARVPLVDQKYIELPIQVENVVHDNEYENYINFSTLDTLEFAVTRTTDQTSICRRAVMPLYERDGENTGPRAIEVMWNKL